MSEATPVMDLSFEKAMTELEAIVARLEKGEVTLEDSIKLYERGEALRARCDALLQDAELRVEKITKAADGALALTPLDAPA
jgi:exodeoxyribonuclease VII small subunit